MNALVRIRTQVGPHLVLIERISLTWRYPLRSAARTTLVESSRLCDCFFKFLAISQRIGSRDYLRGNIPFDLHVHLWGFLNELRWLTWDRRWLLHKGLHLVLDWASTLSGWSQALVFVLFKRIVLLLRLKVNRLNFRSVDFGDKSACEVLNWHLLVYFVGTDGGSTNPEFRFHHSLTVATAFSTIINEELNDHLKRITFPILHIFASGLTPRAKLIKSGVHTHPIRTVVPRNSFRSNIEAVVCCRLVQCFVPF